MIGSSWYSPSQVNICIDIIGQDGYLVGALDMINEKVYINKKYLLILPCSKRKKQMNNLPAIYLYDGPFYRILRKYDLKDIDIIIISAKYGLILSNKLISNYDQKMTVDRAMAIKRETNNRLEKKIMNINYEEIFINLGKIYMLALLESRSMLERKNVLWASGGIGERNHQLKEWLKRVSIKEADQ